ncbi:MAG: hypothetical protein EOO56_19630 [Hymenobacter sp.]|nr:MAG: hypothetical protein EOO56_19630 [Hymenobacter sp.]
MRVLFTCSLFLSSLLAARAQMQKGLLFNSKGLPGTYVLNADRHTRHTGRLRVYARELVAKDAQGHTLKYRPEEVCWAQIGRTRYTTARGFKTRSGLWANKQENRLFVEVLDSGKISLFRYTYYTGGANHTTAELATYLLQEATADSAVTLPVRADNGKGKRFQEVLLPYVASRPDLQQLVEYGAITIDTLPALLHALNSGEPFPYTSVGLPPARPREEMRPMPTGN